jgi:hypothetical protein
VIRPAHEEAFLDDLAVLDRVKIDLIELHALTAFGRDVHLEANDELIAVYVGTFDFDFVHVGSCTTIRLFLRPPCAL